MRNFLHFLLGVFSMLTRSLSKHFSRKIALEITSQILFAIEYYVFFFWSSREILEHANKDFLIPSQKAHTKTFYLKKCHIDSYRNLSNNSSEFLLEVLPKLVFIYRHSQKFLYIFVRRYLEEYRNGFVNDCHLGCLLNFNRQL